MNKLETQKSHFQNQGEKMNIAKPLQHEGKDFNSASYGYTLYPVNEVIYNNNMEKENINPENVSKLKEPNQIDKEEQG